MTPAQRKILAALLDAGGAASVGEVASAVGVHVTTARFHLERMVADGIVTVRPEAVVGSNDGDRAGSSGRGGDGGVRRGRGRPRMQYVALTIPEGDTGSLSEPARSVFEVSRALGFEPQLAASEDAGPGTELTLTACPYRTGSDPVPIEVCRAHEDLLQRTANLAVAGSAAGAGGLGAGPGAAGAPSSAAPTSAPLPPKVRLLPLATTTTCRLRVA